MDSKLGEVEEKLSLFSQKVEALKEEGTCIARDISEAFAALKSKCGEEKKKKVGAKRKRDTPWMSIDKLGYPGLQLVNCFLKLLRKEVMEREKQITGTQAIDYEELVVILPEAFEKIKEAMKLAKVVVNNESWKASNFKELQEKLIKNWPELYEKLETKKQPRVPKIKVAKIARVVGEEEEEEEEEVVDRNALTDVSTPETEIIESSSVLEPSVLEQPQPLSLEERWALVSGQVYKSCYSSLGKAIAPDLARTNFRIFEKSQASEKRLELARLKKMTRDYSEDIYEDVFLEKDVSCCRFTMGKEITELSGTIEENMKKRSAQSVSEKNCSILFEIKSGPSKKDFSTCTILDEEFQEGTLFMPAVVKKLSCCTQGVVREIPFEDGAWCVKIPTEKPVLKFMQTSYKDSPSSCEIKNFLVRTFMTPTGVFGEPGGCWKAEWFQDTRGGDDLVIPENESSLGVFGFFGEAFHNLQGSGGTVLFDSQGCVVKLPLNHPERQEQLGHLREFLRHQEKEVVLGKEEEEWPTSVFGEEKTSTPFVNKVLNLNRSVAMGLVKARIENITPRYDLYAYMSVGEWSSFDSTRLFVLDKTVLEEVSGSLTWGQIQSNTDPAKRFFFLHTKCSSFRASERYGNCLEEIVRERRLSVQPVCTPPKTVTGSFKDLLSFPPTIVATSLATRDVGDLEEDVEEEEFYRLACFLSLSSLAPVLDVRAVDVCEKFAIQIAPLALKPTWVRYFRVRVEPGFIDGLFNIQKVCCDEVLNGELYDFAHDCDGCALFFRVVCIKGVVNVSQEATKLCSSTNKAVESIAVVLENLARAGKWPEKMTENIQNVINVLLRPKVHSETATTASQKPLQVHAGIRDKISLEWWGCATLGRKRLGTQCPRRGVSPRVFTWGTSEVFSHPPF